MSFPRHQVGSLFLKASDIDTQLPSMYMNLFAGILAEMRETEDGSAPQAGPQRRERMEVAHTEAMQQIKKFRKELLDGEEHNAKT